MDAIGVGRQKIRISKIGFLDTAHLPYVNRMDLTFFCQNKPRHSIKMGLCLEEINPIRILWFSLGIKIVRIIDLFILVLTYKPKS